MRVVHLMASPFYGGPERQMLGLARHLPGDVVSAFLSFPERGLAQAFLTEARRHGFQAKALQHNTPRVLACIGEIAAELRDSKADLLCTSGYKPDLIGWRAARRVGIPVVSVSHGWTGATWKVRLYEALDRWVLRRLDAVVCVSQAQADKVRAAGVPDTKINVIRNAIGSEAFVEPNPEVRAEMAAWFSYPPQWIVGAAGRLSPEKGFDVLLKSAAVVCEAYPKAGFILFGDGPLRANLERQAAEWKLHGRFIFAGFRTDLAKFLPNLDLGVMSSFTEGLPVALLETAAAGVPSVATSVGGIPEVIADGTTGLLVPAGDAGALARSIVELLRDDARRRTLGEAARASARRDFSFETMSSQYHTLFKRLTQAQG
ncbi:MAG: glycosyltransferase [Planctomycetes bacterium]|nr:glycosyltransferase [Planctomycetota bacterium]